MQPSPVMPDAGDRAADASLPPGFDKPPPSALHPVLEDRALDGRRLAFALAGVVVGLIVLHLGRDILVPLTLGVLLSYVLEPFVAGLVHIRVPRALGAALVLGAAIGMIGTAAWRWSDDAAAVVARMPAAFARVRDAARARRTGSSPLASVEKLANEIEKTTAPPPQQDTGVPRVRVEQAPVDVRAMLVQGSVGLVALVGQGAVLCCLVYFLLASGDLYKRKLVRLAGPQRRWKRLTLAVLDDIDAAVQRFLLIQLLTCTAVGVASWLAFAAFGLDQAPVWGVAAGVFNVVPYLGAVVVVGGVGIVAFLQFGSATTALAIAVVALAIQSFEGAVLTPKLVGRACRMNDVAVFTSLLVWGWLWGFAGVLLAVPLMMVLKAVCDRIEDLQPLGELLGDG